MDWTEIGLFAGLYGLFGLILFGIRSFRAQIAQTFRNLGPALSELVQKFVWEESTAEDGKTIIRKPSQQVQALVAAFAPALLAQGIEWAKRNVRLKGAGGAAAPLDLANLDPSALIGQLPKEWRGLAGLAMPFLGKFLGGLGGGTAAKAVGTIAENPFLKA